MEHTRSLEMLKQMLLYQWTALIHVVRSLEELQHGTVEKKECGILQTLMNAQPEWPVIWLMLLMWVNSTSLMRVHQFVGNNIISQQYSVFFVVGTQSEEADSDEIQNQDLLSLVNCTLHELSFLTTGNVINQ